MSHSTSESSLPSANNWSLQILLQYSKLSSSDSANHLPLVMVTSSTCNFYTLFINVKLTLILLNVFFFSFFPSPASYHYEHFFCFLHWSANLSSSISQDSDHSRFNVKICSCSSLTTWFITWHSSRPLSIFFLYLQSDSPTWKHYYY